jgi:hypothetical protein
MSNAAQRSTAIAAANTANTSMAADMVGTVGTDLAIKGYDKARAQAFATRFVAAHLLGAFWKGFKHGQQA